MSFKTVFIFAAALLIYSTAYATDDPGFFRTIPSETPERGVIRVSNTSFYSGIKVNSILTKTYGVDNTNIFSSINEFDLGITNSISFNGSLPYYADTFKQMSRNGSKTGAGDVVLGLRYSKKFDNSAFRSISIGTRFRIAEQLGYGPEPLGFRTFSYGKPAYSIDLAAGYKFNRLLCNMSVSMIEFPGITSPDSVFAGDTFYDTGMGYMGIGKADATGLAKGIFEDQIQMSLGTAIPVNSWLSGIVEFNSTLFREKLNIADIGDTLKTNNKSHRDGISTIAYGLRFGKVDGFNMSIGIDQSLNFSKKKDKDIKQIDDTTIMMRVRIPTLSVRDLKRMLTKRKLGNELKARNSFVAVGNFTKTDLTYLYEKDLKKSLFNSLGTQGLLGMVPPEKVKEVSDREKLVPIPEGPRQLGVRLGADFIIQADIEKYRVERSSSLTIPYVLSLPYYNFNLSASASITNLLTGETEQLGVISAEISKPRKMEFFPTGESSFFDYISEPERREAERELVERWVEQFNTVMMDKINILGWEPRKTALKGEEEKG